MFFKQTLLERLFKNAYKGPGLVVGHTTRLDEEGKTKAAYYIAGSYWVIWVDAWNMTKETKAAIIKLCGDLPEEGEVFKAMKGVGNQYEIEQKEIYNIPERFKKATTYLRTTKTLLQSDGVMNRILQAETDLKRVELINNIFIDLVDPTLVNYEKGEYEPLGPQAAEEEKTFVYWGNNSCYLMACTRIISNEETKEYLKQLENIEIV